MNDRYLFRLLAAMFIVMENTMKQKKSWDLEKERCIKAKEEYIVDKYTVSRIMFIHNRVEEIFAKLLNDYQIVFDLRNPLVDRVVNDIYDTIDVENSKCKDSPICFVDDYKKDKSLPAGMIDSFFATNYAYRYIKNNLQKTLDKYNVNLNKIDTAFNKYESFFKKEILVIYE